MLRKLSAENCRFVHIFYPKYRFGHNGWWLVVFGVLSYIDAMTVYAFIKSVELPLNKLTSR